MECLDLTRARTIQRLIAFTPSVIRHIRQGRVRDIRRYCILFRDGSWELKDEFAASKAVQLWPVGGKAPQESGDTGKRGMMLELTIESRYW